MPRPTREVDRLSAPPWASSGQTSCVASPLHFRPLGIASRFTSGEFYWFSSLDEPTHAANTNLTTGKELRESDDLDRCRVCVPALLESYAARAGRCES